MKIFTDATDNQLIHAFKNGDNQALEVLVHRHKDKIFTSIVILVKDKFLAEDFFQEVFIKIIDTLRKGSYNEEGKFSSWAMRIAHNHCVDHFRKVKRTPKITSGDNSDIFDGLQPEDNSADKAIMKGQSHEIIRSLLDMLPVEQREVIILRHYGDFNFKEISKITKSSINTALGRMRYGLLNMRKIMAEKQIAL